MSEEPTNCKQRYKGVENFLRRVAFNLGNTPSQTEVKIISCIPIDVTDLQQKIIQLEKQLEEAKGNAATAHKRTSAVHTALCCSNYPHQSSVAVPSKGVDCACGQSDNTIQCQNCTPSHLNNSNPSLSYPDITSNNQDCRFLSTEGSMTPEDYSNLNCFRKSIFRKKKKAPKKKGFSQMVYYAQPNNYSPFLKHERPDAIPGDVLLSDHNVFSQPYLSDMIRKQYNPGPIVKEYSKTSQFSSPVCRDIRQSCRGTCAYESDICSCCHGKFQNIDKYITNQNYSNSFWTCTQNVSNNRSAYYDSSLYDLFPVKEKPVKVKKDGENKKRETPREMDIKCWPEGIRTKQTTYPLIVNNYTTPAKALVRRVPVKIQNRGEMVYKRTAAKKARTPRTLHEPSTTSCVEFGKVYPKRVDEHKSNQRISVSVQPTRNINIECLRTIANNTDQEPRPNTEPIPIENKTEITLNQIKRILQSVLVEVKTNSTLKNASEATTKKDAVVQKELSQSNIKGSSFIQSFTYSPYDMNPNVATCSRQLASGHLCYSGIPHASAKCMPHYPLFVQPPGRNMCTGCFRNSCYVVKPPVKHATSAATNTEDRDTGKTETEKLLKEIYKSMALTMETPTKDTSTSENDGLKSSDSDYANQLIKSNTGKVRAAATISSILIKTNLPDTTITQTPNTTYDRIIATNDSATQSRLLTTDTDQQISRDIIKHYLHNRQTKSSDSKTDRGRGPRERDIKQNGAMAESEDTDTSSTGGESDDTVIPVQEPVTKTKQKKGLLTKMLKLFKPKERDTEIQNDLKDESEASDSDDYQTVYSHKIIDIAPKHIRQKMHKARPHSKISYSKQMQQRRQGNQERIPERRKPYMEQEYRKYWDEKLTFHENDVRRSSEKNSRDTTPRSRPPYHRNYEARSAMVETDRPAYRPPVLRHGPKITAKGLKWLKKHKLGVHCGEQWKNFILER